MVNGLKEMGRRSSKAEAGWSGPMEKSTKAGGSTGTDGVREGTCMRMVMSMKVNFTMGRNKALVSTTTTMAPDMKATSTTALPMVKVLKYGLMEMCIVDSISTA